MNDRSDANCVGEANLRFARALVGELHLAGVVAAFVCPGSRSTPLALAIAERAGLRRSVHVDERSAAFQALGFAKASGRPVVLLCTSGTAGANFLPAVAEAHRSRVPLVVLTADRPPELRAWVPRRRWSNARCTRASHAGAKKRLVRRSAALRTPMHAR